MMIGIEMKKYLQIILIAFLAVALLSLVFYPTISPVLGIISLLLSFALSTYTIYQSHAETEHARAKKSQRSRRDGSHTCNRHLLWWNCRHAGKLPSGDALG